MPETPTNQSTEESRASEMHVEPTNITPSSDRPSEMQASDVQESGSTPEPSQDNPSGNTEIQMEASNVVVSETPASNILPHPIQVTSELFVTPNLDTPTLICPGAPYRTLSDTSDVSSTNVVPTPRLGDDERMDLSPSGK